MMVRNVIIFRTVWVKAPVNEVGVVGASKILWWMRIRNVQLHINLCSIFLKKSAMPCRLLLFLLATALFLPCDCLGQVSEVMLSVPYKGKEYVGQPLAWDGKEVALFRRDGRISQLPAPDLNKLDIVEDHFKPYGKDEMIAKLRTEFGGKYQVSPTKNFIVVHPPGSAQKWAHPFQDLYYRFGLYFKSDSWRV